MGLFSFSQIVSAKGCPAVKAMLSVKNNGDGTMSGIITSEHSKRLNGTAMSVSTSVLAPTPDSTTYSFTDDLTFKSVAAKGILRTHNVGIIDMATGLFSSINRIDPKESEGIFEGAFGVLYINGRTYDGGETFDAEVTGEVCYAN
jgi:hypothetical protein